MTDLILLKESLESLKALPIAEAGEVLQALIRYFEGEPIGELSQMASAVFPLIKGQCERMVERRERGRANGLKGGRPKNENTIKKKANENQNKTKTKPKQNLNETKTKTPVPVPEPVPVPVPVSPIGDKREWPFTGDAFQEAWAEYRRHRSKLKKPMNDYTEELALKKLVSISGGNEAKAVRIVKQSIDNGWRGLFELKDVPESMTERRTDYDAITMENYLRSLDEGSG